MPSLWFFFEVGERESRPETRLQLLYIAWFPGPLVNKRFIFQSRASGPANEANYPGTRSKHTLMLSIQMFIITGGIYF